MHRPQLRIAILSGVSIRLENVDDPIRGAMRVQVSDSIRRLTE